MAELKTAPTDESVQAFLDSIEDQTKRSDSNALVEMMQKVTGQPPKMWGSAVVGFGSYHYRYETGREGDWFLCEFSPRKGALTLYLHPGFEASSALFERLGKHTRGKACLYVKKLADVDKQVLETLIRDSVESARTTDRPA